LIGTRVGPYEITAKLGEGGMGEVYCARDTKLERDVAIKVLPAAFTEDAERLARFEREAKLLAQLHHPNIASIFGLEESGGVRALVMELVEGPTLDERMARGAVPLDEALAIARQIAEALEEAHAKGIVHRDLKPQNVKLAPDGKVKVLDFGLAKAMEPGEAAMGSASQLVHSPTLTLGATVQGVILGTAAYMAPEQARGLGVDKRADVWAFGVVLWEMLVGGRLFDGELVTDVLANVINRQIDHSTLPAETPAEIRRLVRRCLERKPKHRLHDIADARIVLDEVLAGVEKDAPPASAAPLPQRASRPAWQVALALAAAVGAGALLAVALGALRSAPEGTPRIVSEIRLPAGQTKVGWTPPVLSPDRTRFALALTESESDTRRLWIRNLATGDFRPVSGTEGALRPFWSPDGRSLGYWVDGEIARIDLEGGRPVPLATATSVCGGTWGPEYIVYCASVELALRRIRPSGGESEPTMPKPEGIWAVSPRFLPDGQRFLFLAPPVGSNEGSSQLMIGSVDGSEPRPLLTADSAGWYDRGHLYYLRGGTLLARAFDPRSATFGAGDPQIVAEGVHGQRGGQFSVVGGVAVYAPPPVGGGTRIALYDRSGARRSEIDVDTPVDDLVLAADGRVAAVRKEADDLDRSGRRSYDVWTVDLARKVLTRATFDERDADPVFSPDGKWIAYSREDDLLFRRPANGAGEPERILEGVVGLVPQDWTRDGWIVYRNWTGSQSDLLAVRADGGEPRSLFSTPHNEKHARVSPDGRWLAFASDESGDWQVYVTTWPDLAGKWRVSTGTAAMPIWGSDGRELYFLTGTRRIARAAIGGSGPTPDVGLAEELFPVAPMGTSGAENHRWALSPDGETVYVLEEIPLPANDGPDLFLITNPLGVASK